MKKKLEIIPENKILCYLKNRLSEKQDVIEFFELKQAKIINTRDKKELQELFDLLINGKVELGKNKRNSNEYYIKLSKNSSNESKLVCLVKMLELFSFYKEISANKITWNKFESLTSFTFKDFAISKEIKRLKLTVLETMILLKTVEGFLKGSHPVFLSEIIERHSELIQASIFLSDENNLLIKEDLIRVQTDQDGVSMRINITKKTLFLIGEKNGFMDENKSFEIQNPLLEIIKSGSLPKLELHYTPALKSVYKDFCSLSKTIDKSENLSLLLHGAPGTGKTAFAYQLAKEIDGTIFQLNFSQIQSKWVGETEKNIRRVFDCYRESWQKTKKPIILLINEADGLMNKRVAINTSNDSFANQAQTELLEQLENFKGILIATTNLIKNIDSAFHRRFLFKSEVTPPEETIRISYLKTSSLYPLLNENQIIQLHNAQWTIAEMKNIERKIQLIQRVRKLTSSDIESILFNESILNTCKQEIGYSTK